MLVILVNLVAPVNSTIKQFRMICLSVNGVDGRAVSVGRSWISKRQGYQNQKEANP